VLIRGGKVKGSSGRSATTSSAANPGHGPAPRNRKKARSKYGAKARKGQRRP